MFISKIRIQTRGAAFVEYIVLLGLVGVIAITAVVELGGEVEGSFNGTSNILEAQGLTVAEAEQSNPTAAPTAPIVETWQTISTTPFAPPTDSQDPGRYYQDFVVVLVEQSPGIYRHTYSLPASHNPAEIAAVADLDPIAASFVGLPVAPPTSAAGLCTEASMHTGSIMDTVTSFFPPIFGGTDEDIGIENLLVVALGDEPEHYGDGYVVHTSSSTATTPSFGQGETIQAIYAFTCSRPL